MVEGVAQLTRNLTKVIPARVQQAARAAMEQGAEETVAMMKRLVPVKSGTLRDSIGWTWGKAPAGSMILGTVGSHDYKTMRITIYAGGDNDDFAFYGRFVEFGTQNAPAHPFFFVSWRVMKKRVRSRISRNIRAAIKAEGGE